MKTSILTSQHFTTSQWSGGSTTQLYISPAGASYADRNFEVRISTAKVEVEQSTFTSLPGVHRKLMILEGEITVTHEGHYSKSLKPFEVDTFSGDWTTTAVGTCIDFNVMTIGSIQTELYHLELLANSNFELKPNSRCRSLFIYPTTDSVELLIKAQKQILPKGHLLAIDNLNIESILLRSKNTNNLVVVELN